MARFQYVRHMDDEGNVLVKGTDGQYFRLNLVAFTNVTNPDADEVVEGDTILIPDYVILHQACWNCGGSGIRCCEFGAAG